MPLYSVLVRDLTIRRYIIEADSEEEAQECMESGNYPAWSGKLIDGEWIAEVEGLAEGEEDI